MLPITFCIIYCEKDKQYLDDCLNSLPVGSQVVLMKTVPSSANFIKVFQPITSNGLEIIRAEFEYKNEYKSFSLFRNECKKLATREWIFSIDADERIIDKSDFIYFSEFSNDIGFVTVVINSEYYPNANGIVKKESIPIVRMHRNKENINWINRCHEQLIEHPIKQKYKVIEVPILIKHLGYNLDNDELTIKLDRNLELLFKDLADDPCNDYLRERTFSHFLKLNEIGKLNILKT